MRGGGDMLESGPERVLAELRRRVDPGLPPIDWEILLGLATGQTDEETAQAIERTAATVRRRVAAPEALLLDGIGARPCHELLVSWYHLHADEAPRRAQK